MLYGLPAHTFSALTNAVPEKCAIVLIDLEKKQQQLEKSLESKVVEVEYNSISIR